MGVAANRRPVRSLSAQCGGASVRCRTDGCAWESTRGSFCCPTRTALCPRAAQWFQGRAQCAPTRWLEWPPTVGWRMGLGLSARGGVFLEQKRTLHACDQVRMVNVHRAAVCLTPHIQRIGQGASWPGTQFERGIPPRAVCCGCFNATPVSCCGILSSFFVIYPGFNI